MAKHRSGEYLSRGELAGGTVFFILYLLVLPRAADPLFRLAELLLDVNISSGLQTTIYYYLIFAVTAVIFHGLLARTSRKLADNLGLALKTLAAGLIAMYGLNELMYRLTRALVGNQTNLNDLSVSARIHAAPHTTLLIVIFLAPFVEEVLFRGLIFGGLRERSRLTAYLVSCLLFAFLHVWQYSLGSGDIRYFWLMLQYFAPGAVLAWAFEHSGTLWTSIALHAAVNALSVLALRF